jgi:Uma2 family endonuclease
MSIASPTGPPTIADLIDELGVSPNRIHLHPPPGTATEADVIALCDRKIYCELIDGVLVEKAVGQYESRIAMWIGYFLLDYIERGHDLGVVHGSDSPHRFFSGQIRYPDVAFVSYDRLPDGKPTRDPIAPWVPNLAVEIISPSNTTKEMRNKLDVYFSSGVELVWYVYPDSRTVEVYSAAEELQTLAEEDTLDGNLVLPGFRLSIATLFEKAD